MNAPEKSREQLLEEVQRLESQLEQVKQSEFRWRQLAQTAPDVIVSIARDGTILLINRPVAGASRIEDFIGVSCYTLIPPQQHDIFRRAVEHVFATGEPTEYEVSAYGLDGVLRWWASHFGPVIEDGRVVAGTVCASDISARKRAEEEVHLTAQELARSNRELEQFAYIASHDLQEPLRKVQAFGDMLVSRHGSAIDDEGRDYLQRMQNAARRMQVLINDLLAFSRVATQAKPFVELDLGRIAHEVVSDLEMRIRESGGQILVGELPRLDGDPLQMRQLLQNLIGNGLKYRRPDEPPRVEVQSRKLSNSLAGTREPTLPRFEISVSDNGIGFDEKYLDRIFAPFQRLHGRGEYEGTGMGLAICYKIVERHGGTITARSAPGQGATFLVTLPVRQSKGAGRESS